MGAAFAAPMRVTLTAIAESEICIADQPACFGFPRALRSVASIACVSALRMLRVRASPTFSKTMRAIWSGLVFAMSSSEPSSAGRRLGVYFCTLVTNDKSIS
jgi:hypothetical protein